MRDHKKDCGSRPNLPVAETVDFCIKQLFKDDLYSLGDVVVNGLTYEELLGALLQARDLIETLQNEETEGYLDV